MSLVEYAVMAESQRLDALLDQVVEWHGLEAFGLAAGADAQPWPRTTEATPTETTPRAGRKRARAPASPQQQLEKRRAQSSMHRWQEEAVKLWETRTETIAAASAGSDKRMASWQKRKVELQTLREEVRQLEEQLRTLQDDSASTEESRNRRCRQRQYVEIAWKLAAEREQALAEAAVAENTRLKNMLDRYLELSRVLHAALFQDSSADLPRQARLQSIVERTTLFASMEQKLTARLPNVKAVIRRTVTSASAPADGHNMHVIGINTSHPVGSIQQSRTFPFRVDAVIDAKWNCAQRGFPDVAARTHSAEVLSEDTLGLDIIVDLPPQAPASIRVCLHLRGVLKRWETPAGSIVQFAGMTEWQTESTTTVPLTEEYSWSTTRALNAHRGESRSSHMQRSTESTLVSLGASPEGDKDRTSDHAASHELMEKVIMPCIQHVTDRIDQATENALLDAARCA